MILLVVELPVAPVGKTQIYEVAPEMGLTENTCPVAFRQTPSGPEIDVATPKANVPLSMVPSQLSSIPLQISVAAGLIAELPSLQSNELVTYPDGTVGLEEVVKTVELPYVSPSASR